MERMKRRMERLTAVQTNASCTRICVHVSMVFYIRVARGVGFLHSCFTTKKVNPSPVSHPSGDVFWCAIGDADLGESCLSSLLGRG